MRPCSHDMSSFSVNWVLPRLIGFLVLSAVYLYAFPQANLVYPAIVLLHAAGGVLAAILLAIWLVRQWRQQSWLLRIAMLFLFGGAAIGAVLIYTGTPRFEWSLVYAHLGLSFMGARLMFAGLLGERGKGGQPATVRIITVSI